MQYPAARNSGKYLPFVYVGQSYKNPNESPPRKMPSGIEMERIMKAIDELNNKDPYNYNIASLIWWLLWKEELHMEGVAEDDFTTYAEQNETQYQIGIDHGFCPYNYTYLDCFEEGSKPQGDGYILGASINGINGWTCSYQDINGLWHSGHGIDEIIKTTVADGEYTDRTVGKLEPGHPVSPPAELYVCNNDSIALNNTTERYMVVDFLAQVKSTNGIDKSSVTFYLLDSLGTVSLALSVTNTSVPVLELPHVNKSVPLQNVKLSNDFQFGFRLVLDSKDGSVDVIENRFGEKFLASDIIGFPGGIPQNERPVEVSLQHKTSDHSILYLNSIQSFATNRYPGPIPR